MKQTELTRIDTMPGTKMKFVRPNKNNFWLLELMYGDAAWDKTARFQLPHNVRFKSL